MERAARRVFLALPLQRHARADHLDDVGAGEQIVDEGVGDAGHAKRQDATLRLPWEKVARERAGAALARTSSRLTAPAAEGLAQPASRCFTSFDTSPMSALAGQSRLEHGHQLAHVGRAGGAGFADRGVDRGDDSRPRPSSPAGSAR